ncbi:MAG: Uma2 family endonuclease [Gemmataceae bacterium]
MATIQVPTKPRRATPSNGAALFEILDGRKVEVHVSAWEISLANFLAARIRESLGQPPHGEPFVEMLFRMRPTVRKDRRPDLAFVSYERWPDRKVPRDPEAWEMVPDLAVEIVSKNNSAEEIQEKVKEYLACGVKEVWVVYPRARQILVYKTAKEARVLDEDDLLEGGEILPGFSLRVRDLLD